MLDVACGTGNLAIPAARAGARVTGVDIAPNLIARARLEARSRRRHDQLRRGRCRGASLWRWPVRHHGDDVRRDVRLSAGAGGGGVASGDRPGGRVAMANWTPEGFVGQMLRAHTAVVPPPSGVPSPLVWGEEDTVRARFGDRVSSLTCTRRTLELRFPLPPASRDRTVRHVLRTYGRRHSARPIPTVRADSASALTGLFQQHNLANRRNDHGGRRISRRPGTSRLTIPIIPD